MGNYDNELRWKIIRANNLLQFIHQQSIQLSTTPDPANAQNECDLYIYLQNLSSDSISTRVGCCCVCV